MTAEMLVATIEQGGVRLRVEGDRLKLEAPADRVPSLEAIAGLRENKAAVVEYLRDRSQPRRIQFFSFPAPVVRKTEKLETGSPESFEAERRFVQPHAKLFPFLGRKVRTPGGPGTLIQVFADRVTVLLDAELSRCSFFHPGQIEPACLKGYRADTFSLPTRDAEDAARRTAIRAGGYRKTQKRSARR